MDWFLIPVLAAVMLMCRQLWKRLEKLEEQVRRQQSTIDSAAGLLAEQSTRQQEAERAERLFREGLQNILNYGVK